MKSIRSIAVSTIISTSALVALGGCAGTAKVTAPAAEPAPSRQEIAQSVLSGKVVETMTSGGYTYISLEKDGKTVWAAVPTMAVKVGDVLELQPGNEMGPFTSKSLNRTFDKIIFSGGPIAKGSAQPAPLPPGHPALPAASSQKNASTPAVQDNLAGKPFYSGKVVETMNAGSYTYICLEKEGKKSWVAVPRADVKVGEDINVLPGMEMGQFKSKTLNRTFDNIIFSSGIAPK
jgi:hypothetical protein